MEEVLTAAGAIVVEEKVWEVSDVASENDY
jgi:hypothetical protein